MTVAEFMALALAHPEHGYYRRREPFGRDGDFITAPEISQMFGELIGLWCVSVWRAMGAPGAFHWVEFGPGRGTLMADAWRAAKGAPAFRAAARIALVETAERLRAIQRDTLAGVGATAHWVDGAADLPDGPVIAIANEFVDALPIHQLARRETGWHERLLALDPDAPEAIALTLSPGPSARAGLLPPDVRRAAPVGAVAEVRPAGLAFAAEMGGRVARFGGAALIVDYGHAASAPGDTLQAVRGHAYAPVFEAVGEADITAHVDFAALGRAARDAGAVVHGPVPQGAFLTALGIETRAQALARAAGPDGARAIARARDRLIGADAMGTLFKALAIAAPDLPVPAGFEGTP